MNYDEMYLKISEHKKTTLFETLMIKQQTLLLISFEKVHAFRDSTYFLNLTKFNAFLCSFFWDANKSSENMYTSGDIKGKNIFSC